MYSENVSHDALLILSGRVISDNHLPYNFKVVIFQGPLFI